MADETGTTPPTPAAAGAGNAQGAQETRPQLGIQTQYVKDLSFENPSALERPPEAERSPQITVNVQVEARRLNEQTFEVVLQITAQASHEEKPVFLVELSYAGVFNFIGIPDNAMEPALLIECPRLLFPFARRIVADVTRDGGFPAAPARADRLPRPLSQPPAAGGSGAGGRGSGRRGPAARSRADLRRSGRGRAYGRRRRWGRLAHCFRHAYNSPTASWPNSFRPSTFLSRTWFRWMLGSSPGMTICWWGTVGKTTDRPGHWGMNFGVGRRWRGFAGG